MTPSTNLLAASTALALSRGGLVHAEPLILRLLSACKALPNGATVAARDELKAVIMAWVEYDELAFSGARHDLVTALGRYWAEVSAAGEETA